MVDRAQGEDAQITRALRSRRGRMRIGEVDIGEGEAARRLMRQAGISALAGGFLNGTRIQKQDDIVHLAIVGAVVGRPSQPHEVCVEGGCKHDCLEPPQEVGGEGLGDRAAVLFQARDGHGLAQEVGGVEIERGHPERAAIVLGDRVGRVAQA